MATSRSPSLPQPSPSPCGARRSLFCLPGAFSSTLESTVPRTLLCISSNARSVREHIRRERWGHLPPPLTLPSRLCLQYPLTVVMGGRDRYKICRSARSLGAPPQARMQIFKICTGQDDRIHTSQCTVNYMRPVCHLMHRIFGSRPLRADVLGSLSSIPKCAKSSDPAF